MRKKPQALIEAESRRAFVEWAESEAGKTWLRHVTEERERLERKRKKGQGK